MKINKSIIYFIVLSLLLVGCASPTPEAPSTLEIMNILETKVNEKDLEGLMTLFTEDSVWDESYINSVYYGTKEIERQWIKFLRRPFINEFRDISVEGDSATFIWAEVGTSYTELWPTIIEVQNGKITYLDWYEDSETLLTGDE